MGDPRQVMSSLSDTAYWVAFYRAMETDRPDALFRDPYARRLAGERGERIVRALRRGRSMAWSMIVRTAVLDEIIVERVRRESIGLVLNLAAGLDARPYRLALPPSLEWVEADLPGIIDYKRDKLAAEKPACKLERVEIDLRDRDARRRLFAQLGERAERVLVISEGLLVYLDPADVGALASDLHETRSFHFWLTDLAAPKVLQMVNRSWGKQLKSAGAAFRFGPAEGGEFFRPFGWREAEFRGLLEESRRLNRRMPLDWLIRFWEVVTPRRTARRMKLWRSGVLLLQRLEQP
ncbi:MAG: class I SAM-dependent methyltransferase [Acidobacteriota bacterium]|nr:class I SAM-dependent methyltransferase [Acidobacteriota bacterium]